MSDSKLTLAATPVCAAHAGTAAKRAIEHFGKASTNIASSLVLKSPLDAQ